MNRNIHIESWPQVGFLVICFAFLYAHTVQHLVLDWCTDENFSHGFLIPFLSGFMIWQRREDWIKKEIKPSIWGLSIIALAMAMHIAGNIGAELFVMRSSIVVCLMGIVLYFFGFSIFSAVSVPILYLFFMIPIPAIIWNKIAFPLQLLAARLAAGLVQLMGITLLREGNILHLSNMTLEVVDACSGLRSLTALLALSAAFAYLSRLRNIDKFILFLSAIPIAIAVNVIRLTTTAVCARYVSPEIAHGFLHDFSGVLVFMISIALLYGIKAALLRLEGVFIGGG